MKIIRFSETKIVTILKQADAGIKIKDLCREHGISDATYDNWKAVWRARGVRSQASQGNRKEANSAN